MSFTKFRKTYIRKSKFFGEFNKRSLPNEFIQFGSAYFDSIVIIHFLRQLNMATDIKSAQILVVHL